YFKRNADSPEPMVREVDPYALANYFGVWMMVGFDHLRNDIRTFRLDRMETVLVTAKVFTRPKNFNLVQMFRQKQSQTSGEIYQVKIAREIFRWVKEQPPYKLIRTQSKKNYVILTIESPSEDSVITWLLRWGNKAEALSPQSFRDNVKSTLDTLLKIYQ
ncbi:MAG: WYL domain-containing protein, partial [Bacteroidota bacterium]|nr:WYL domain-containing protein [Bacteroidota bacterium]